MNKEQLEAIRYRLETDLDDEFVLRHKDRHTLLAEVDRLTAEIERLRGQLRGEYVDDVRIEALLPKLEELGWTKPLAMTIIEKALAKLADQNVDVTLLLSDPDTHHYLEDLSICEALDNLIRSVVKSGDCSVCHGIAVSHPKQCHYPDCELIALCEAIVGEKA